MLLATLGEEAAIVAKNENWAFWCLLFVWRFSEWAGFRDTGMGFSRSCRGELEVPAEQLDLVLYFK